MAIWIYTISKIALCRANTGVRVKTHRSGSDCRTGAERSCWCLRGKIYQSSSYESVLFVKVQMTELSKVGNVNQPGGTVGTGVTTGSRDS